MINLEKTLNELKRVAKEVGKYQLDKLNTDINIKKKSTKIDLVSEVDKISEDKIIKWINSNFPDHNILAEESGITQNNSDYEWVIDPLDGTTNYIHGFPLFSISIALMKESKPILGLIYVPYTEEMFTALENKGSYLNGKKIRVSGNKNLEDTLLVSGFPYDLTEDRYNNIDIFNSLLLKTRGVRRIGSAAYDLACVAAGRFDGFWELKLNPWDVMAGIIITKEAGGKVIETTIDGHYLIIAGTDKVSDSLLEIIEEIYE